MKTKPSSPTPFSWAVPEELQIPPDPLRARLDFHRQACVLTLFEGDVTTTRLVSAMEVAHTLASELTFSTGLLPEEILWWTNTAGGPVYALYQAPRMRKLALQVQAMGEPRRFTIPLPGFIFLCSPGQPPWVFAVKRKPAKLTEPVYKAPLCNVFSDGRSCPGNHKYPTRVEEMVESFFTSFFSATADLMNRSVAFPNSVVDLWQFLDGQKTYPLEDLVRHGTVQDLINMTMRDRR